MSLQGIPSNNAQIASLIGAAGMHTNLSGVQQGILTSGMLSGTELDPMLMGGFGAPMPQIPGNMGAGFGATAMPGAGANPYMMYGGAGLGGGVGQTLSTLSGSMQSVGFGAGGGGALGGVQLNPLDFRGATIQEKLYNAQMTQAQMMQMPGFQSATFRQPSPADFMAAAQQGGQAGGMAAGGAQGGGMGQFFGLLQGMMSAFAGGGQQAGPIGGGSQQQGLEAMLPLLLIIGMMGAAQQQRGA